MKNIAIIYHDADFDGKLSNEVCRFHLKRLHPEARILSYGWDYGRPVPDDEARTHRITVEGGSANTTYQWTDYDAIYIVDLSVDELMARPELSEKIVWIDHHKSAIEKWDRPPSNDNPEPTIFKGYRIDGVAACRLCWHYFTWDAGPFGEPATKNDFIDRKVIEPRLIRLAGEYDVWDHRNPDGKALQFGLRALAQPSFELLVQEEFTGKSDSAFTLMDITLTRGHIIKGYIDQQNAENSRKNACTVQFYDLSFCCLNIGGPGNSDMVLPAYDPAKHDALMVWGYRGDHVSVSLYHAPGREELDLSDIAKRWGGGGHKGACGFRATLIQMVKILNGLYA